MKNLEYISATIDGEANDPSSAVDALLNDEQARGAWQRFHLARDVMQSDYTPALPANFADRVRDEIACEAPLTNVVSIQSALSQPAPAETPVRAENHMGFWKPFAGLAVAASLIGGAILTSQQGSETSAPRQRSPSVVESPDRPKTTSSETLIADSSPAPGTRWQLEADSAYNSQRVARLNSLLTNHLEVASMGKVQGMMAHSRVVGYDASTGETN